MNDDPFGRVLSQQFGWRPTEDVAPVDDAHALAQIERAVAAAAFPSTDRAAGERALVGVVAALRRDLENRRQEPPPTALYSEQARLGDLAEELRLAIHSLSGDNREVLRDVQHKLNARRAGQFWPVGTDDLKAMYAQRYMDSDLDFVLYEIARCAWAREAQRWKDSGGRPRHWPEANLIFSVETILHEYGIEAGMTKQMRTVVAHLYAAATGESADKHESRLWRHIQRFFNRKSSMAIGERWLRCCHAISAPSERR